eukprot:CAMPEP_0204527702 /NCGR_PEP_ID=MMETSP0661-20131031/9126_1 /ASSEMBLY_ACC=CAM_ASM_000606 /TAXON_ID=109239 /ORGANISM="Alexandrium margalefi, Strain AMGDE01CS-322" /LENGTH=242 /DNA_ID=CAMNT_0051533633 /DNA_START=195 /DNA_END=925 /DNA_ORIENTATION=-
MITLDQSESGEQGILAGLSALDLSAAALFCSSVSVGFSSSPALDAELEAIAKLLVDLLVAVPDPGDLGKRLRALLVQVLLDNTRVQQLPVDAELAKLLVEPLVVVPLHGDRARLLRVAQDLVLPQHPTGEAREEDPQEHHVELVDADLEALAKLLVEPLAVVLLLGEHLHAVRDEARPDDTHDLQQRLAGEDRGKVVRTATLNLVDAELEALAELEAPASQEERPCALVCCAKVHGAARSIM